MSVIIQHVVWLNIILPNLIEDKNRFKIFQLSAILLNVILLNVVAPHLAMTQKKMF
jgi:hypothetical protein